MPCHAYSYAARDAFPIDCGFFSARQSSRVFISVGDSERPFTVSSRFRLFRSVRGAHGGAPEGRYRGGDTPDIGRDAGVRVPRAEAPARARGSVRVPRRLSRARDTPRSALDPVSAEDAIRASDANLGSVGLRCHRRAGADRPRVAANRGGTTATSRRRVSVRVRRPRPGPTGARTRTTRGRDTTPCTPFSHLRPPRAVPHPAPNPQHRRARSRPRVQGEDAFRVREEGGSSPSQAGGAAAPAETIGEHPRRRDGDDVGVGGALPPQLARELAGGERHGRGEQHAKASLGRERVGEERRTGERSRGWREDGTGGTNE